MMGLLILRGKMICRWREIQRLLSIDNGICGCGKMREVLDFEENSSFCNGSGIALSRRSGIIASMLFLLLFFPSPEIHKALETQRHKDRYSTYNLPYLPPPFSRSYLRRDIIDNRNSTTANSQGAITRIQKSMYAFARPNFIKISAALFLHLKL